MIGELFDLLRKKRKELADEANVPPYIIFPDTTLIEIAAYFPQSEESLLTMQGVGTAKLEKYGTIFLNLISHYCMTHHLEEKPKRAWKTTLAKARSNSQRRHIAVGEAYNAGKSVEDLMTEFGVKQNTILNHLSKYLLEGHETQSSRRLFEAFNAFRRTTRDRT